METYIVYSTMPYKEYGTTTSKANANNAVKAIRLLYGIDAYISRIE